MTKHVSALLLALSASVIQAQDSPCCEALRSSGLNVYLPDDAAYQDRTDSYFSISAQLHPWCFVQPIETKEVASVVDTLREHPSCVDTKFAVRSGGHAPWAGANNIDDGVTVDLGMMNATVLDLPRNVAGVQPGSRWGRVYGTLDPLNYTVAGGRAISVGVGGFLTGGGNSFFSARYGFGTDTVKNFEVVLATGEVINANSTENTDLFQVLKGGSGSNYGIVTRYDMLAIEGSTLWGGTALYNKSEGQKLIDAHVAWTDNVQNYPPGSAVLIFNYERSLGDIAVLTFYHDTEGREAPPAFDEFLAIPQTSNTLRFASHQNMSGDLDIPFGFRNIWHTTTIRNDPRIYNKFVEIHAQLVDEWKAEVSDPEFTAAMNFQAIPTIFTEHSVANGGNVLGLDRVDENVVMIHFLMSVKTVELEVKATEKIKKYGAEMDAFAASVDGLVEWKHLNYAGGDQDPLASYGEENNKKMRAASAKYDPTGFFQNKTPTGFKLSKSGTV